MQHVVVKEQDVYERTDTFIINNNLSLGKGLLSTLGETHRRQRKMLNPVFSIAHMREMIPIFYDVAHRLGDSIQAKVQDGPTTIDVLKLDDQDCPGAGWAKRPRLLFRFSD
ncbi:hypothetical protein FA13DRAFT_215971 [Coprinellus micaceus]|uniref:Cytochrome P450 n=1 Tax=Coprinellus micaceus TaxID=71717 RepID=A0A4Y7TGJ2_COPMI|nr:hypothetical protein FA13DRAFT_215971 [Coprinellus micaceus]